MKTLFPIVLALSTPAAFADLPAIGPDYARPLMNAPAAYREEIADLPWKIAEPAETMIRGDWWALFGDPVLDGLESRALAANQELQAAAARVEQARAAAGFARSAGWPQIAVGGAFARERTSATTDNVAPMAQTETWRAPLVGSWEMDLFGRVRRLKESARADAAASAATFESVRLALTAEVAGNYFSYRAVEHELALVRDTAALRRRAVELVSARQRSGTAADFDVARAETELATAEAESAALANRRAALQHALAVFVGEPAPGFAVPAAGATLAVSPVVPVGLPAALLERRPDIAAAERELAAASARIGVAKAAFFPAISLTGSGGFASGEIDRLFDGGSRLWSIGPSLYLPLFQGGRNRANLERSRAAYDESLAAFRQRILVAFREVQDALTATQWLAEESAAQDRALKAARRAAELAQVRYDAGYVTYLEVIDTQRTSLAVERASTRLGSVRLNATVALIKALGGGWKEPALGRVALR